MKAFELKEVTKPQQSFAYTVPSNTNLTAVLIAVKPMDADIRLSVRLTGRGANARVIGLVAGRGGYRISIHTKQLHEAPETTSSLLVKAALYDSAQFSYNGVIRVEAGAQKSDAYQKNENLLLSEGARARSDPALEILANDVRCTHGSTTGTLSDDQLWYLMSRGLQRITAEKLLVRGFFEQAMSTISDTLCQQHVRRVFTV